MSSPTHRPLKGAPVSADELSDVLAWLDGHWDEPHLEKVRSAAQILLAPARGRNWPEGTFLTFGHGEAAADLTTPAAKWTRKNFLKAKSYLNTALALACRRLGHPLSARLNRDAPRDAYRLEWDNFRRGAARDAPDEAGRPGSLAAAGGLLVESWEELIQWNVRIASTAEECLATTGSRSRDAAYLGAIERRLAEVPHVTHYRVLFGQPFTELFKDHLRRLLHIRPPSDRRHGRKTLCLAIYEALLQPEAFLCANEKAALVVLPSFRGVGEYTTAVVFQRPDVVRGYIGLVKGLYVAGRPLESPSDVDALCVSSGSYKYV